MTTKINNKQDLILDFIRQFRDLGAENCFSNGMCWHFATILCNRFTPYANKVYDPIINHFATEIDGRIYDITGDITDSKEYKWELWASYYYKDMKETTRILRDCADKIPADVKVCGYCDHCYGDDFGNYICDIDNSSRDLDELCDKEV